MRTEQFEDKASSEKTSRTTPEEAFAWGLVSFVIACLAWGFGPLIASNHELGNPLSWFIKGLAALALSGFTVALIAYAIRVAIFGKKKSG